ncbi:MAG: hypothetical protein JWQ43_804 [Glaciihabitans sp.]|nr:hypothetical protein [Glaciihabitans sp.]
MRAPTGEQFVLTLDTETGRTEAIITQLAASLRTLKVNGVDISQPYAEDRVTPFGTGIVLVPWPNRVEDGRWMLDGTSQQLDITEPKYNNAIHGLLRNTAYTVVSRTDSAITLGATVFPQHGYPFMLETTVSYELQPDGITVTHSVRNESAANAPVAIGTHPFFQIGDVDTAELTLTVRASTRFPVDARLNVSAEVPVEGRYDLNAGARVGDLELDDAFGGLDPIDQVSATLAAPDGRTVSLWQDENFPYLQVFTTPIYPTADGVTLAVAIEPMTAPADAFNSGQSLRWLAPAEQWTASWGVRYTA